MHAATVVCKNACNEKVVEKLCVKKMHAREFVEREKVWLQSKLNSQGVLRKGY